MVFDNWKRELFVNGDRLGTCTDVKFDSFTIDVTAHEDEVNCFETVLRFYTSCIVDLQIDGKKIILITKNPLAKKM